MSSRRLREFHEDLVVAVISMNSAWRRRELLELSLHQILVVYLREYMPFDEQVWGEADIIANSIHAMLVVMDADLEAFVPKLFLRAGTPILLRQPKFEWFMFEGELALFEATSRTGVPIPTWLN